MQGNISIHFSVIKEMQMIVIVANLYAFLLGMVYGFKL